MPQIPLIVRLFFCFNFKVKPNSDSSTKGSITNSRLREKMGFSGGFFDFYGDQLKKSGVIKIKNEQTQQESGYNNTTNDQLTSGHGYIQPTNNSYGPGPGYNNHIQNQPIYEGKLNNYFN